MVFQLLFGDLGAPSAFRTSLRKHTAAGCIGHGNGCVSRSWQILKHDLPLLYLSKGLWSFHFHFDIF